MSDTEQPGKSKPASIEELRTSNVILWETLDAIVLMNNIFIGEMHKSTTLAPDDQERVRRWSMAVAKAHKRVDDIHKALNPRSGKTKAQ